MSQKANRPENRLLSLQRWFLSFHFYCRMVGIHNILSVMRLDRFMYPSIITTIKVINICKYNT